ncbi:MAG TPA: hypothetical protein VE344_01085 [Methylomirabilota bacterium]|nr:hypothetical protein [Methylomirabilota bacterium]
MNDLTQFRWLPVVLLTCSNLFMTFAWDSNPASPSAGGAAESSPQ